MKKLLLGYGLILAAVFLLCGCVDKVVVSEVLQQPLDAKLYTNYNLWYSDPMKVSCLNVQRGEMIPLGTEVEVLECDEKKVTFRTVENQQLFTIEFNYGERMYPMADFIRQTFGFKNQAELLKEIRSQFQTNAKQGELTEGMTKAEVARICGPVPLIRTPDPKNMTWIYFTDNNRTIRLLFRGDVLKNIISLED